MIPPVHVRAATVQQHDDRACRIAPGSKVKRDAVECVGREVFVHRFHCIQASNATNAFVFKKAF
jgi:hypothetical protein